MRFLRRLIVAAALAVVAAVASAAAVSASPQATWKVTDIAPPSGLPSYVADVNRAGQALISQVADPYTGAQRAFLWQNDVLTALGNLGGGNTQAAHLSDNGFVTGVSSTASGDPDAFLWRGGTMRDLGTLGGGISYGTGVNNSGVVVGQSLTAAGEWHAFVWRNGMMYDLPTLGDHLRPRSRSAIAS
jgi:probable HAF family extracellular repeat protein